MTDGQRLIELRNVTKIYGSGEAEVAALAGINLAVQDGEFVAVMGPSGSGKSTCMNILGCLDTPTDGHYYFRGADVGSMTREQRALLRRHYIGFVFQGFNLLARTDAINNVALPLFYAGVSTRERRARALTMLTEVGLADRAHHKPSELSGGQQQRVAIARALVNDPAVLLADEPTGNLDTKTSADIMALIDQLHAGGRTIIMVTHDENIARNARRVVRLLDGAIVSDEAMDHQKVAKG